MENRQLWLGMLAAAGALALLANPATAQESNPQDCVSNYQ